MSIESRADKKLLYASSAILFVLCAWPLVLVTLPPYQDVPNLLASVFVIDNPDLYPELVTNSFFKTNAAVYAWVHFAGALVGRIWAMRLFIVLVLAMNAYAFPRLVLELGGAKRLFVATFFLAPSVHNWFVSMGMLNFALGVPLALLTIVALQAQRRAPTRARALAITVLAALTWYAHIVPFAVVLFLFAIELAVVFFRARPEAKTLALHAGLPLALSVGLALVRRFGDVGSGHHGPPRWTALWEVPYLLWAKWAYAFTELSAATIVSCGLLLVLGVRRWREPVPFFSPAALVLLALIYAFAPQTVASWFFANTRLAPFVWAALLVRVPERLPRPVLVGLAAISLSFSASLGIDFRRLDADRAAFDAGISHVPDRARLMPFIFERRGTSVNTDHLVNAWGSYVLAKRTAAPLVFARSPAYGVTYRERPPPALDHLALVAAIPPLRDPASYCADANIAAAECIPRWEEAWRALFALVEPRFSHLLVWGATDETRTRIPPSYRVIFTEGKLTIYARD